MTSSLQADVTPRSNSHEQQKSSQYGKTFDLRAPVTDKIVLQPNTRESKEVAMNEEQRKMLHLAIIQQQQKTQQLMICASNGQRSGDSLVDKALSKAHITPPSNVPSASCFPLKRGELLPRSSASLEEKKTLMQTEVHILDESPSPSPISDPSQIVEWTSTLDSALRQLDKEHCGDWKRIGLRMNLHPSLCRGRLSALLKQDEAKITDEQERVEFMMEKDRRARKEAEIINKSERSRFFRSMRQCKKRKNIDNHEQENHPGKPENKKPVHSFERTITGDKSKNGCPSIFTANKADHVIDDKSGVSPRKQDAQIGPEPSSETMDTGVGTGNAGNIESSNSTFRKESPNGLSDTIPCSSDGEGSYSNNSQYSTEHESEAKAEVTKLDTFYRKPSRVPGNVKIDSPRETIGLENGTSENGNQYRKGYFFRVTKMHPGKKKESLGFIALPKTTSFAEARIKMVDELDLNDSWVFFLSSLGPVSRKQESSLGMMVSWLTVKHREMPGSRRNPIDIIIVDRR